jgi:hypothetical protein
MLSDNGRVLRLDTLWFAHLKGPAWGTDVNEPGGRLFGEAIRAPGVRRKWFSWEAPFYATMGIATLMLTVGLSSRPPTSAQVR